MPKTLHIRCQHTRLWDVFCKDACALPFFKKCYKIVIEFFHRCQDALSCLFLKQGDISIEDDKLFRCAICYGIQFAYDGVEALEWIDNLPRSLEYIACDGCGILAAGQ